MKSLFVNGLNEVIIHEGSLTLLQLLTLGSKYSLNMKYGLKCKVLFLRPSF